MSVLQTPRINFGGQISWDPIVTNNYPNLYDESTCWTVFEPRQSVEQFREAADSEQSIKGGNWNPQGTHRSEFYDTFVSGVDVGNGAQNDDPFVSSPVSFEGMLVDSEPYGAYTSQLFFDQMSFGIDGGCRIFAPRTTRLTARYINFNRLPRSVYAYAASSASVVWQTSFPKSDGLKIDTHDSAVLQALAAALAEDDVLGLTVQFNCYSTHYFGAATDSEIPAREQELVDNLAGGGFQPNPARSQVIGTIGLWNKGEPAHEPGERAMLAARARAPKYVATAHARLDDDQLTVDLSNSISESDLENKKENLGPLTFYAKDPSSGTETSLGTIDYGNYDRDAYLASAGIVGLKLDPASARAAAAGDLLMKGEDGTLYLEEQALRAIPSDPNVYINAGETTTTEVRVLDKGVPAGSGIKVAMELESSSVAQSTTAVTNADGIAVFDIKGAKGQVQGFILSVDPSAGGAGQIDPQINTYLYIRTYPRDDRTIGGLEPIWENVYKYCLSNWNAMAPCMDNWLDLNDEKQVRAYGPMLKKLTDPKNFEDFRFMPVTRDMTQNERNLLYRFLDGDSADEVKLASSPGEEGVDHAALSRSLRRAK